MLGLQNWANQVGVRCLVRTEKNDDQEFHETTLINDFIFPADH
jgi:hypothetical protein